MWQWKCTIKPTETWFKILRSDVEKHIKYFWENIRPDMDLQSINTDYGVIPSELEFDFGTSFDFSSIMLIGSTSNAKEIFFYFVYSWDWTLNIDIFHILTLITTKYSDPIIIPKKLPKTRVSWLLSK